MENFYSKNNPLYPKPADMNRRIQLMNAQMGSPFAMRGGGYYNPKLLMSSPFDSYKCDNAENIDPQILLSLSSGSSSSGDNFSSPSALSRVRYRGGYDRSPLSLVESSGNTSSASATKSPSAFVNTPLTMEDDVPFMDEVFVVNALGGRSRYGKDSSGSSASSVKNYKMDVCNSWAETGSCHFGSSCQFSHKKEELGVARLSNKGKPELEICFPQSPFANSSISSFKGHNSRPTMSRGSVVHGRSLQGSATVGNFRGSQAEGSGSGHSTTSIDSRSPITGLDWIPQDDGIDARPPGSQNPSRYEVLACINNYLYAPRVKNRLHVFASICPDAPGSSSSCPTNKS